MLSSKESVGSGLGILHETWKTKAVGDEGLAIFCLSSSFLLDALLLRLQFLPVLPQLVQRGIKPVHFTLPSVSSALSRICWTPGTSGASVL